jgi:hypothetical protein
LQIDNSDASKEHQAILFAARPLAATSASMKQWCESKREEAKNNGPEVLLERDASLFDFWRCRGKGKTQTRQKPWFFELKGRFSIILMHRHGFGITNGA